MMKNQILFLNNYEKIIEFDDIFGILDSNSLILKDSTGIEISGNISSPVLEQGYEAVQKIQIKNNERRSNTNSV